MKKTTWIKLIACLIAGIPPMVVLFVKFPVILSRTDKTLSLAAILVLIVLVLIFKDAVKRFFETPGYLKFSLVILIMCALLLSLAEEMLIISLTATISGLCALPLNIWYNALTRPATAKEIENMLKKEKPDEERPPQDI